MSKTIFLRTAISVVSAFVLAVLVFAVIAMTHGPALGEADALPSDDVAKASVNDDSAPLAVVPVSEEAAPLTAYPVNASGQTYGTFVDAEAIGELPDLILAEATNGQTGCIYKTDFIRTSRQASNPQEAAAFMKEYRQANVTAFNDYLQKKTGSKVDASAISAVFDDMDSAGYFGCDWASLTSDQQTAITNLLPVNNRSVDIAKGAYAAATQANYVSVPVYALDGQTAIGELIVQ